MRLSCSAAVALLLVAAAHALSLSGPSSNVTSYLVGDTITAVSIITPPGAPNGLRWQGSLSGLGGYVPPAAPIPLGINVLVNHATSVNGSYTSMLNIGRVEFDVGPVDDVFPPGWAHLTLGSLSTPPNPTLYSASSDLGSRKRMWLVGDQVPDGGRVYAFWPDNTTRAPAALPALSALAFSAVVVSPTSSDSTAIALFDNDEISGLSALYLYVGDKAVADGSITAIEAAGLTTGQLFVLGPQPVSNVPVPTNKNVSAQWIPIYPSVLDATDVRQAATAAKAFFFPRLTAGAWQPRSDDVGLLVFVSPVSSTLYSVRIPSMSSPAKPPVRLAGRPLNGNPPSTIAALGSIAFGCRGACVLLGQTNMTPTANNQVFELTLGSDTTGDAGGASSNSMVSIASTRGTVGSVWTAIIPADTLLGPGWFLVADGNPGPSGGQLSALYHKKSAYVVPPTVQWAASTLDGNSGWVQIGAYHPNYSPYVKNPVVADPVITTFTLFINSTSVVEPGVELVTVLANVSVVNGTYYYFSWPNASALDYVTNSSDYTVPMMLVAEGTNGTSMPYFFRAAVIPPDPPVKNNALSHLYGNNWGVWLSFLLPLTCTAILFCIIIITMVSMDMYQLKQRLSPKSVVSEPDLEASAKD